jgi:hypothetical protein
MADLAMGLMGALGSAAGGLVLGLWGFLALNAAGAVLVIAPLVSALALRAGLEPRAPAPREVEPSVR